MDDHYIPTPIDISGIALDDHLLGLTERLAKHAHDLWALQRLRDGWKWGPVRCDTNRAHPCLIPYEDLPEAEKEYDRRAALGTIKAVIASGYRITMSPMKERAEPVVAADGGA